MRKKDMSPLRLLQEIYYPNEWKILVCCILLNQTSGTQVHSIIRAFFAQYPTAKSLANARPKKLAASIKSCGLHNKRAETLIRFSQEYLWKQWEQPKELHGIGTYGQESWQIFIKKDDIEPHDKELKRYMQWKRGEIVDPISVVNHTRVKQWRKNNS